MGYSDQNSLGDTLSKIFSMLKQLTTRVETIESTGGSMQYRTYTDGITLVREGVRDGAYVIDKTLTETGFAGTEDLDWEQIGGNT